MFQWQQSSTTILVIQWLFGMAFLTSMHFNTVESSSSSASSQQEWNVPLILQACPDIASTRICDPDHVLNEIVSTSASTTGSKNDDDKVDQSGLNGNNNKNSNENENSNSTKDQSTREEYSATADPISTALYELETKHPLTCQDGTRSDASTFTTPVQMAVVVVQELEMNGKHYLDQEYKINQGKIVATALHDTWGVGTTECGGSGILLFLSITDRVVYLSIGTGLVPILTSNRIDAIIDDMKPFLREDEYTQAIVNCIFSIIRYVDQGPPSFVEKYMVFILFGFVALGMWGLDHWKKKKKREYVRIKSHLEKMDRERAMALMGKFECTSCPICLEDFEKVQPGDAQNVGSTTTTTSSTLGSDGKPLQLLQCGHAFDKTCWDHWISKNTRNIHQCPICKQDIGGSVDNVDYTNCYQQQDIATTTTRENNGNDVTSLEQQQRPLVSSYFGATPNGSNILYRSRFTAQQQREIYEMDRQFRIHRLRHRYPYYIQQSHVDRWSRNDYDGPMAQDKEFVNRDPNLVTSGWNSSNHTTSNSQGHSFGSFGGGHSGGGGGGTW
jgi:Beta-propeller domains of methanol dehydrogenase type